MNYSMGDGDIKSYLGADTVTIKYEELSSINDLDKFMQDKKYIVILYLTEKNYGHWTCLINHRIRGVFEFFDSYGTRPDYQLDDMPLRIRNNFGQDMPLLSVLLLDSKKKIEYSNYKLQKAHKKITTCGKWVVMRCLMSIPIDVFGELFIDKPCPDKYLEILWKDMKKSYGNKH